MRLANVLTLLICALANSVTPLQAAERPNVLFIAIDDLNDWIGHLGGHPQAKTPNMDRLARRGVTFLRACCAAPVCNPSRAALMSGRRPYTSGVYLNSSGRWRTAMPNVVSLNEHFMNHGYYVAGAGKIYHGGRYEQDDWSEFFNRELSSIERPTPEHRVFFFSDGSDVPFAPLDVDDEGTIDTDMVRWVIERLEKEQDKPFFLACGLYKPHLPWYVPKKYYDMYPLSEIVLPKVRENDLDDIPPIGVEIAHSRGNFEEIVEAGLWEQCVQAYLAAVSYTDANVGRLLDALDRSRYANNTIIMLWGDHGWHFGEKQHWFKNTLWEEAARAPYMIAAPGVSKTGSQCLRTVDFMSIYPTLTDLCGLPTPEHVEGVSLRPLLVDPDAQWDRPAITTRGMGNHAIRSERFRYIQYSDGTEELYDHDADPMEWTNLASNPEFSSVKKELARWLPKQSAPNTPKKPKSKKKKAKKKAKKSSSRE